MEFKNRHAVHYPQFVPRTVDDTVGHKSVREVPQMRVVPQVAPGSLADTHEERISLPPAHMVGYLYLLRQTEYIIRRCEAQLQKIEKTTQISLRDLRRKRRKE